MVCRSGTLAIAKSLLCSTSLKRLWLDDVGMGQEAGLAFAAALQSPSCALGQLWIGSNHLNDEVALAFAAVLPRVKSLHKLWLNDNEFGGKAAHKLLTAALDPECSLKHLWLGGRNISKACQQELVTTCRFTRIAEHVSAWLHADLYQSLAAECAR